MRRRSWLLLLMMVVVPLFTFWVLISPGNPLTAAVQAKMSDTGARVIAGPYPLESDLRLLRQKGVKTIVSLLDPRLPYERVLIEREKKLAKTYGMKVLNFPMTNILGQPVREEYARMAASAAKAVQEADGKVYLHCYLGLHRTKSVQILLEGAGTPAVTYEGRKVERPIEKRLLEQAEEEYNKGNYSVALKTLSKLKNSDTAARLLEAWAHYRLGEIETAAIIFEEIAKQSPEQADAHLGLAYCALRQGNLAAADQSFSLVLEMKPDDLSALVGMGLLRDRQERPEDAAVYLRKALQLDPNNGEARGVLKRIEG